MSRLLKWFPKRQQSAEANGTRKEIELPRKRSVMALLGIEREAIKKSALMDDENSELQTRIITLNYGENLEELVFRLQKGWILRFVRGSNLMGRDIKIVTSIKGNIEWSKDKDEFAMHAEVKCMKAGSFSYQFYVDDEKEPGGCGYVLVMPELYINDTYLPINALSCITHISKLLGEWNTWKDRLKVAHKAGYNMIHFTPVQMLGISNSSYCIADPLRLNPAFNAPAKPFTYDELATVIKFLEVDYQMLSMQDVVWNHAARNAPWLLEHPECAYNLENSPHLRPAFLLDRLLYYFTLDIIDGKWAHRGIVSHLYSENQLKSLIDVLKEEILPQFRIHEFFQVNVDKLSQQFSEKLKGDMPEKPLNENLESETGPDWERFGFTVNMDRANLIFNRHRDNECDEEHRRSKCLDAFINHLHYLNKLAYENSFSMIKTIVEAVHGHVSYERIELHGPRRPAITKEHGLVTNYFVQPFESTSLEEDEKHAYNNEDGRQILACNGWVMNDNPLHNFAHYPSQVYLLRHLVCWGDCIKLRYGDNPDDCPYLWNLMKEYTIKCAKVFHALRIDNCHSTPINVAEYLLRVAREARPDIYVTAELFTSSENLDSIFVNRLGITSLIREAQNASISFEQGRFVYRYGGDIYGGFIQKPMTDAVSCVAPALFFDQTHDNPPATLKRSEHDLVPTAAMLAMSSCGIGSVRGYDELVPFKVDVVHEKRLYSTWDDIRPSPGIIPARAALNKLHAYLAYNDYTQVYVDQRNDDIVAITRHNPVTHEKIILISYTAFNKAHICEKCPNVSDLHFAGLLEEIVLEIEFHMDERVPGHSDSNIVGLKGSEVKIREHIQPKDSKMVTIHQNDCETSLHFTYFPSGSVIAIKVSPIAKASEAVKTIRSYLAPDSAKINQELKVCLHKMTLQAYNFILFRCKEEEEVDYGKQTYNIPNFGHLIYCGFRGLLPYLNDIRFYNDLGHPICANLREGLWLCDFLTHRLLRNNQHGRSTRLAGILNDIFQPLKDVPFDLRPCYFEALFSRIYEQITEELMLKLTPPYPHYKSLLDASVFVQTLALSSVAFLGSVKDASLSFLPEGTRLEDPEPSSLAAGLPHFSVGLWRNWGRDTFIALPGCCLVTGRYRDAKNLILSYGGAMRHGLIPNLLDKGPGARYNARDAVWFWLHAICKYIMTAPNGIDILKAPVERIFVHDDTVYGHDLTLQPLVEVIQETLTRHYEGIDFVERRAGHELDRLMQEQGFHVKAYIDPETGFVCGGNRYNCGTWMDKMGSSGQSGNYGWPATPRDGAAVELQGLAFAVLMQLQAMCMQGLYPHPGITPKGCEPCTWYQWAQRIADNFERRFYVGDNDQSEYVNRRGIVKDTYGSTAHYTDYQLRPNFVITLALAPSLLSEDKAWKALQIAQDNLLGPLGIKTLDPSDLNYCPYYDQSDGYDRKTACGWSYHQGPEWLWIAMYFYKAKLAVAKRISEAVGKPFHDPTLYEKTKRYVSSRMGPYWEYLKRSPWTSLPELTNADGERCYASCEAQAWTIGCLLEVVQEIYDLAGTSS